MDELSKFPYSVWLLRLLCFGYYYHKTSTAVYPVPRYFFTVNTVDEILSTAHPYSLYYFRWSVMSFSKGSTLALHVVRHNKTQCLVSVRPLVGLPIAWILKNLWMSYWEIMRKRKPVAHTVPLNPGNCDNSRSSRWNWPHSLQLCIVLKNQLSLLYYSLLSVLVFSNND